MLLKKVQSYLKKWLFLTKNEQSLLQLLKFSIGEQYEIYEFDLESTGNKTINEITYEVYLYSKGDFKKLFGLPISRGIILFYNADILSSVYYRFNGNQFEYLLNKINSYLPQNKKMDIIPFESYIAFCKINSEVEITLKVRKNGQTDLILKKEQKYSGSNIGQTF